MRRIESRLVMRRLSLGCHLWAAVRVGVWVRGRVPAVGLTASVGWGAWKMMCGGRERGSDSLVEGLCCAWWASFGAGRWPWVGHSGGRAWASGAATLLLLDSICESERDPQPSPQGGEG